MRRLFLYLLVILIVPLATGPASAQDQEEEMTLQIDVGGVYTAWFQNQQDFFMGRVDYNDQYAVQMLRLNVGLGYGDYVRAVTRFDMAQGWWGVDNADWRGDWDDDDNASLSSRFSKKGTNYLFHVDLAYLEFLLPFAPVTGRLGRMYYGLGNKLVLDSNLDGLQADIALGQGTLGFAYAKVYEGADLITDNDRSDQGGVDAEDADLWMTTYNRTAGDGRLQYGLFGMYYRDRGDGDLTTYLPNDIDYFRSRFTPNISTLMAVGLTGRYQDNDLGLSVEGEVDYLTGTDDIDNVSSGPNQLLDINNGDLSGYNIYMRASKSVGDRLEVGVLLGRGSGDDDLSRGDGNVNKLKTMGFFYLTEVWEDSIMPDEEGITPQGLGAPNTRGYRELENTTALQGSIAYSVTPAVRVSGAATLLRATEEIRGWNDVNNDGVIIPVEFSDEASNDIGTELDFNITYRMYDRLVWGLRGGYLWAGDGAQLLINGNSRFDSNPWELKGTVAFRF